MKITIYIEDEYAEAMKLMYPYLRDDDGRFFVNRNEMITFILKKTVDCYPEFMRRAIVNASMDRALKEVKREKPMPYFGERSVKEGVAYMLSEEKVQEEEVPLSESEKAIMKEIFGDAYQPSTDTPLLAQPEPTQLAAIPNKSDVPHETPLPELPEI